jgi:alkylated DNA repair protein alkB family protein 1
MTAFRRAEKRYQLRKSEAPGSTDLRDVIDFQYLHRNSPANRADIVEVELNCPHRPSQKCYTLRSHPGFFVLPAFLSHTEIFDCALFCLSECTRPPHVTNFDLGVSGPVEDLWAQALAEKDAEESRVAEEEAKPKKSKQKQKLKKKETASAIEQSLPKSGILRKLAWATQGYHFDWTSRCYHANRCSHMPPEFAKLGARVMQVLKACEMRTSTEVEGSTGTNSISLSTGPKSINSLSVEAAIVNFYKWDLYRPMGGHRDDLELTFDHPVVSVSLGLDALFLLGGATLGNTDDASATTTDDDGATKGATVITPEFSSEPSEQSIMACFVREGDVMVLGGESRLAYHGVPRILRPGEAFANRGECSDGSGRGSCSEGGGVPTGEKRAGTVGDQIRRQCEGQDADDRMQREIDLVQEYLRESRININLRQVLADGHSFPTTATGSSPPATD